MNRLGLLAVLLCLCLAGCSASKVVTMDEYNQVTEGMTYSQVVSIIGEEGKENASSKIDPLPGTVRTIVVKSYIWENSDGSNMVCVFQNDKLITKGQRSL